MDLNETIESKRFNIRRIQMSDYASLSELLTHPDVVRHTRARLPQSPGQILERLEKQSARPTTPFPTGVWVAETLTSNNPQAWFMLIPTDQGLEMGYMIAPRAKGQGIATEVAHTLVKTAFARLKIDKIIAFTDADNAASIRVLEKAGFKTDPELVSSECAKAFSVRNTS